MSDSPNPLILWALLYGAVLGLDCVVADHAPAPRIYRNRESFFTQQLMQDEIQSKYEFKSLSLPAITVEANREFAFNPETDKCVATFPIIDEDKLETALDFSRIDPALKRWYYEESWRFNCMGLQKALYPSRINRAKTERRRRNRHFVNIQPIPGKTSVPEFYAYERYWGSNEREGRHYWWMDLKPELQRYYRGKKPKKRGYG